MYKKQSDVTGLGRLPVGCYWRAAIGESGRSPGRSARYVPHTGSDNMVSHKVLVQMCDPPGLLAMGHCDTVTSQKIWALSLAKELKAPDDVRAVEAPSRLS